MTEVPVPDGASPRPGTASAAGRAVTRSLWFPHQHGAWAMLAVPLLLGIAASRPEPWQLVLAAAAVAGYLASATWQAWMRARRRPSYVFSLRVYGTTFAVLAAALVATHPPITLAGLVVVPVAAIAFLGARPGARRDLGDSLAQVVEALVLTPVAAYLSGSFEPPTVAIYTAIAATYLVGTVVVVRSVIRERGNTAFAAGSIGYHAALVAAAAIWLPGQYAVVAAGLTARAVALPVVQRRRAGTSHPLRPVQVGAVEAVAALVVVLVAFVVPAVPAG